MKILKFIDLFAGIGGMRLAFESAGAECVLTCEINEDALTTYKANFKDSNNHTYHNDILTLTKDIVPSHNILVAGFPCQPYSIAGLRKGLEDERGGDVFLSILKILITLILIHLMIKTGTVSYALLFLFLCLLQKLRVFIILMKYLSNQKKYLQFLKTDYI